MRFRLPSLVEMAKRGRAPTPPKRPQAPRRRTPPRGNDARRRTILYAAAVLGALALVAVSALLASGRGGVSSDPTAALKKAGCTYKVVKATKAGQHVNNLNAKPNWNTFPPSSGPHYPIPAVWDFYTEPVPLMQAVHNLEHGGIAIEWGNKVPKAEIDKIARFYNESPNAMLAFPLSQLGNTIALVAWTQKPTEVRGQGRVAECRRFDRSAFKAFRDAFRGKGPERFPVDRLRPGS
jgi:hypothetical protein